MPRSIRTIRSTRTTGGIRTARTRGFRGLLAASVAGLLLGAGTLMTGASADARNARAAADPAPNPIAPTPALPAGAVHGHDISWTQCSPALGGFANPMPDADAKFVVIGLSNGRAFTENPCLADQLAFARSHHLLTAAYVFPTYPTNAQYATYGTKGPYPRSTVRGRLMNVGWAQAANWTATAKRVGLRTPMVWVDVEQRRTNYRWTARPADRNLPVLQGLLAGLKHYGYRTGIYTTASHWTEITGGVRLGLPEWTATGATTATAALATCRTPGRQGSPVVLAQFTNASKTIDYDVLCPATNNATYRARFFRQY